MMAEIEQVKTIVVLDSDSLDAIAAKVNLWHQSAINLATTSLDYVKNCGVALLEAKARCGHGRWLDWLAEKCPDISERTCQRYMRIAQEWPAIEAAASDTPLTAAGALTLIASHTIKSDTLSDLRHERSASSGSRPSHAAEPVCPTEADSQPSSGSSAPVPAERQAALVAGGHSQRPAVQDRPIEEMFDFMRDLLGEVMTKSSRMNGIAKDTRKRVDGGSDLIGAADRLVRLTAECSGLLSQWRAASGV